MTGGAGFLGSHLVDALMDDGNDKYGEEGSKFSQFLGGYEYRAFDYHRVFLEVYGYFFRLRPSLAISSFRIVLSWHLN